MKVLEVKNLRKIYKKTNTEALKNVNFSVEKNEFVAIMGESGSGKSTLLNIIATLDKPTSGSVLINENNIESLTSDKLANFRREELGFVFQDFNLIDTFNVKDNILLPLVLSNVNHKNFDERLNEVAKELNISEIINKNVNQLSGGQKQRVAIARALITNPSLILADEPTGQLDSKSSEIVMNTFENINKNNNTILMVTHSIRSASFAQRVLFIKDGILFHEIYRGEISNIDFAEKISNSLTLLNRMGE
ncbi:ABC transporter ATP-binding protein [Helcococcus kunzii]|uniref:Putative bacteriocin export ABC transporter, lactococcin 972 group n=1 Tax=Helcococcus kunzii ATCC 51366 TaxID=883114 RepID=H3NMF0_9FIRM|nr:ABC transporter ATP-binding protein [Helcococcus kunzii]EHR35085.1 putative bacteriocin export ABC transporter, lactococcin 972 group [Helcococcus kunzii ATCC 51366]MCT1796048.1 ABC transporter ATP-binding protein [Helcococcus kunzii]MCT1988611.1 ABC transporter ATP-binding protein [Helcococcus kunzii]QUY64462.1 ABC transporter ATP-binding protein [Helcococcus kunzii]QZO76873.1 ABC transporter ATP-binding protein [Helcococcus kunzii]